MVAGEAGKLGVLGPDIFLVVTFAFRAPGEALHRGAELYGLACAPIADADPRRIFHGFSGLGFEGLLPMARHDSGKGIEFKIKVGMARSDHFVVYEFVFGAEVAFQTFFGAVNYVSRFRHAELDGFFVWPTGCGVLTEPAGSGPVTIFAGNTFGDFEFAALLLRLCVERVTGEAFRRVFGFRAHFQNPGHVFAGIARERLIGAAVLIFQNPSGIFGLENAAPSDGFDAAVTTRGGAGARANIFHWFGGGILRIRV